MGEAIEARLGKVCSSEALPVRRANLDDSNVSVWLFAAKMEIVRDISNSLKEEYLLAYRKDDSRGTVQ